MILAADDAGGLTPAKEDKAKTAKKSCCQAYYPLLHNLYDFIQFPPSVNYIFKFGKYNNSVRCIKGGAQEAPGSEYKR